MALIGQIAISMTTNTAGLTKGLNSARKDLNVFASNVTALGVELTVLGAIGAAALGKVILAASNLQEQVDRVITHFGESSPKILEFAKTIGTAFGLAKTDILASAASFETFFSNAGYAEDAVADLAIHFTRLGTDIARDINMPTAQALLKLKSGLAGEAEAVRQLGVSMLEANIKAYAYQKGIAKVGTELTDFQKIRTRAAYLTDKFSKSEDNLAKTGDKVAGAIEAVKGRFENLSATIGESLLLIAAPAFGEIQIGLQALQTLWVSVADTAIGSSSATVEGLTAENHSIGLLQSSIGYLADGWQVVGEVFKGTQALIVLGLKSIGNSVLQVVELYATLKSAITGKDFQAAAGLKAFVGNLDEAYEKQLEELHKFRNAQVAPAAIDAAFTQARKDIAEARKKLAGMGKLDVLNVKQGIDPSAVIGQQHKGFANAAGFGSQEAVNTILSSAYGSPKMGGGAAAQTAQNTAKTNVLLEQIVRQGGRLAGNAAGALLDAF